MVKVSGRVYRSGSRERITGASIKAFQGGRVVFATTDDDGDYAIELPEPGEWELIVLDAGSFPNKPLKIELTEDQAGIDFFLNGIEGEADETSGRRMFWILLASFGLLIALYVVLHILFQEAAAQPGFAIWSTDPLRFLEIILWSLGGILVNKIIMTGWYLRSHRFYREGVLMHIGHIVTTPVLVLVTVLLLSLATLTFTLTGDNELTLDLSDPRIMVAFAFLIGTSPWPLWRLIENSAKRLTSQFD